MNATSASTPTQNPLTIAALRALWYTLTPTISISMAPQASTSSGRIGSSPENCVIHWFIGRRSLHN